MCFFKSITFILLKMNREKQIKTSNGNKWEKNILPFIHPFLSFYVENDGKKEEKLSGELILCTICIVLWNFRSRIYKTRFTIHTIIIIMKAQQQKTEREIICFKTDSIEIMITQKGVKIENKKHFFFTIKISL